jgi:hypothetical protein
MLDGSHALISGAVSDEINSLVHSSERRHIDGLSLHDTTATNSGGILSWATVTNGIDQKLIFLEGCQENLN